MTILFVGKLPQKSNGAFTADEDAVHLVEAMLHYDNVSHVENLDAVVEALRTNGIAARAAYEDVKLEPVCRTDESGSYYFLFNNGKATNAEIILSGSGKPVLIDAWTGTLTAVPYAQLEHSVKVQVTLANREAKIIALMPEAETAGTKTEIGTIHLDTFDTTIESWGPDSAAEIPTQSKKTVLPLGSQPLGSWNKFPVTSKQLETLGVDEMGHVAGRASYQTTFTLPACNGAVLTIQTGDCMVVGGSINGKELPTVNQRSGKVDLTGLAHEGENTLELIIATTLINRLRITHPLFDGKGGIPGPPAPDASVDGDEPMTENLINEDYELPSAPMDMPTLDSGEYFYGIYSVEVTAYRAE